MSVDDLRRTRGAAPGLRVPDVAPRDDVPRDDFLLRASRLLFYAGLVAVSLMVFRVGGGVTVGDVLLLASCALLPVCLARPRVRHPYGGWAVAIAGLVLVGGVLATFGSPYPVDSLANLARVVYVAVVLPWQAVVLLDTDARLVRGMVSIGAGAAVSSLGTLLQFGLGGQVIPGGEVTSAGRYTGFTGHVSDTGAVSAVAVAVGLAGLTGHLSVRLRAALLVILVSGVVGLVLSGSVSGMLASFAAVVVLLLLRGMSLGRVVGVGVIGWGALWAGGQLIARTQSALSPLERIYQVFGVGVSESSLVTSASRWDTIVAGWNGFLADPLTGVGLDNQSSLVFPTLSVHNFVVALLFQGGLVFTAGVIIAVVVALRAALRVDRRFWMVRTVLALGVSAVVFALTAPSFYNRYFWIPVAMLAVVSALRRRRAAAGSDAGLDVGADAAVGG